MNARERVRVGNFILTKFTAWATAYHIERVGGKKKPNRAKPNP